MDRWAALSMVESGDNDYAIGSAGEISRFQIRRTLWPGGNAQNPQLALAVAQDLMRQRLEKFEKNSKRPATDFEFYVLWNAPAKINRPSRIVIERARRYANLVQMKEIQVASSTKTAS
ncbi:MAG: hypothetical protein WDM76_02095 [Limisphaerales bacterium]